MYVHLHRAYFTYYSSRDYLHTALCKSPTTLPSLFKHDSPGPISRITFPESILTSLRASISTSLKAWREDRRHPRLCRPIYVSHMRMNMWHDMTHSCMWHDMTQSYVWHDSDRDITRTWLIHIVDIMTHSYVWLDTSICVTWHDSFICVTSTGHWLFICVTRTGWRICIGSLNLHVHFRKRATNYMALLCGNRRAN